MPSRQRLEGLRPADLVLIRLWELDCRGHSEQDLRASTREGLAGFFLVSAQRMSRDLNRLQSQGLLQKHDSAVTGRKRHLSVFVPTLQGKKRATVLHRTLQETEVELDGNARRLDEILKELPVKVGVAGAARFIRRGRFDREGCLKVEMGRIAAITGRGMLPAGAEEFVGRAAEVEKIRDFLIDRRHGVLVVDGIPGIGKSALTLHAIAAWVKGEVPFWYDFVESASSRHLLDAMAYHLLTRDRPLLERCLASLPDDRLSEAVPVLRREMSPLKSLLIFDNVQRAGGEALELFGHLLTLANANHSLRYVLVTRDGPGTTKFVRSHVPEGTAQLTIGGLGEAEAGRLWKRLHGIGKFEDAWRAVGGHPHLLTLAASVEGEIAPMVSVAAEHLGRWLDLEEREALDTVTVFRHPVQLEALDELGLRDHVALRRLVEKRFLAEDRGGLITVHDTLREVALGSIPGERKMALDSAAAKYWVSIGGPAGLEEAAFHLGRSGDEEGVRRFLLEHGRVLTAAGYATSVEKLFERGTQVISTSTGGKAAGNAEESELLLVRASLENARGRFIEAEAYYQRVAREPDTSDWSATRARIEQANILQRLGRRNDALVVLRGLSMPLDAPGYEEARLFHILGSTYEALDDLQRAEKYHRMSLVVPTSNAKALGYLGLGRVHWRRGDFHVALEEFSLAAEGAETAGEKESELNAKLFITNCLLRLADSESGRTMEAIRLLEHIERDSERFGLLRQLAYANNNLADAYRWLYLFQKARMYIDKAIGIFNEIGEAQMRNQCKATLCFILLDTGDAPAAKQLAEEILTFSEGGFPVDFKIRQIGALAYVFEETQEFDRARQLLESGLNLARISHLETHEKGLLARLNSLPN